MAGRRLVAAAKLFNASKGIAQQHIKLRSQQLDVYSKTSSLAKAAKNQTDRLTLTLEAARALSQRLNEEAPQYAAAAAAAAAGRAQTVRSQRPRGDTKPSAGVAVEDAANGADTFSHRPEAEAPKKPLADEHGTRAADDEGMRPVESRASTIPLSGKSAGVSEPRIMAAAQMRAQHEDPNRIPSHANEPYRPTIAPRVQKLQEGHGRDVFHARSVESEPASSQSPKTQIPKLAETHQESHVHVNDEQLNQDVYNSAPKSNQKQRENEDVPQLSDVSEHESVPEGINTNVFRTKRVAKMLGGNPYQQQPDVHPKGAVGTPHDRAASAQGHNQDSFIVPRSGEDQSLKIETPITPLQSADVDTQNDMRHLAAQLAKDTDAAEAPNSKQHHRYTAR